MSKRTEPVPCPARASERASMLFKGTTITRGSGAGVVVSTGLATELGKVTQLVLEAGAKRSPLERKLARLSRQLAWAALAAAAAIAVLGLAAAVIQSRWSRRPSRLPWRPFPRGCRSWRPSPWRGACGAWRAKCADRAPFGGGDARRHHDHPDGQDRHLDRKPDDRTAALSSFGRSHVVCRFFQGRRAR